MRFILFIMLLSVFAIAQTAAILTEVEPEFYTLNLDSTETATVYYIFPPPQGQQSPRRTAISETAPTSSSSQATYQVYNANGAFTISIVTDSVTADESDSLYAFIRPLFYDSGKSSFYLSTNDTLFLIFDTPQSYIATSADYLNWTHGNLYSSMLGPYLCPAAGFGLTFVQTANDNSGADANIYIGFWRNK